MAHKKKIGLPGGPNEIIVDPKGQWNHPGKNTRIESNHITMQDVPYPVWAQPNIGPGTMMMPGSEHHFKNADYVDEYPMAQDGTEIPDEAAVPNKSFLYDLEKLINTSLGDINNKAKNFSENNEELNNTDNMRHASGGRYAAEAIQQKVRDMPYVGGLLDFVGVDKAAGFVGANVMGIGHELRTIFGGDERPFLAKLQEMGEDTFNNYVGSIVGSLGIDDSKKDEVIRYLSYNNLLPDGYVRTEQGKKDGLSEDIYFKDEDGKRKTAYQRGGGLLDKTMKCNSCGWEWKAADGGSDIDTCHKCGGKALAKAQTGTEKNFRDFEGVPLLSSLVAGDIPGDQHHKSRLADLYRYYAGRTLEDDILEVSNTKPTKAKDTDVKYISLNKNQQLVQEVIDNYNRVSTGNFYTNKTRPDLIMSADDNEIQLDTNNYKVTGYKEVDDIDDHQLNAIGNYFTGLGEDDNGTYISYYDKFDQAGGLGGSINFGEVLGLTKPFEIYDRIYVEKDSETGKYIQKKQDGGQPTQPETWQDTINYIDQEKLKRAIAQAESLNGKLMKNPDSTASGLYGQRFSELQKGKLYDGTRDEFIADLEAQNRMFDVRLNEGFKSNKTTPLLKDAYDLMNEYKPQIENFDFSYEDIISLSNFLGRQGTREYLGNVIRDGKTLQDVYPKLYGESVEQANKTPEEYLNITRGYYKQYAGEMEMREVAQDNTRVASPIFRDLPNLGFQPQSPLQQFLIDAESEVDLLNINDRTVAQDNTAVARRFVPPINIGDSRAIVDYDQVIGDIRQENDLEESLYDSPALIAEFIRKSNEYASGWKDMTDASDAEVKDLQNVLLGKGYGIGPTGADGDYGTKTLAAHRAMVDDTNLNPSSISRYYNKFDLDNKQEVMGIQKILVDKGFLAPTLIGKQSSSIDGKFGDQTKDALDAFNTENAEDDPKAQVFDYIPSALEEPRCAAGMCQILEGNQVLTDALGVKFKDAWDIFENMTESKNSDTIFNIYDDKAFDNVSSVEDLKRITKKVKRKKQTTESDYQIGDIVGLYWDGSSHHNETLNSKTHNTHSGFVSDIVDGVPIITHNVNGDVRQQPYNELVTAWIRRPNENLDIKSQYNVDGIEEMQFDSSGIQNLAFRYSGTDVDDKVVYEGERLEQLENIFKRVQFNANKIPKILNSSVDSKWLESTVVGITGVETGVGKTVPRTKNDYGKVRNLVYDVKGKKDEDISLGIGKTKFNSLDSFAKEYFNIKSVDDLAEDNKGIDAVTYMITKNYELFKDYSKTYPQLGLTETDIRNMTILSYNQGASRLLKTGRVDDNRSAQEEVDALRELYDATLLDISSTNYSHIPVVGNQVFELATAIGLEKPSDSYIKKVNQYRADVFPETFASVEAVDNEFQPSTMAQGGEYGVYNNYMSGKYDGTSREKGAMELYDKLNRKHYQEAKQTGMSVPNYIMSQLIKDS